MQVLYDGNIYLMQAAGGVNRYSFVVGVFLIAASILSILRQTGQLDVNIEVPVLVIVLGGLMVIGHLLRLPMPKWMEPVNQTPRP